MLEPVNNKQGTMLLFTALILILHENIYINAIDLNSILPRAVCFVDQQENCNEDFIDVYKNLSKSVTGLTDADTFMLLYTRKNPEEPEKLHKCAGRLPPNSNFNPDNKLVVIFMQYFFSYCNTAAYREWTAQLLIKEDLNIIIIDYSWGNKPDPSIAIENVRRVVRYQAAILIRNIQEQTGLHDKNRITFIGHSLGGQLAGLVANDIKVSRIIGIDPAGPGFAEEKIAPEDRLDSSDADLVETWNTNAGKCLPYIGNGDNPGHVNFYFNGGKVQPSCHKVGFLSFIRGDYVYAFGSILPMFCYHIQATQFFRVSINPEGCQFVGVKCDSYLTFKLGGCRSCGSNGENCLIAGWETDKYITEIPSTPQKYYIETTNDCPYCDNSYLDLDGYEETYKSATQ